MTDRTLEELNRRLAAAQPYVAAAAELHTRDLGDLSRRGHRPASSDPALGVEVIRFLISREAIDLGEYVAWNRSAIAFKNTYGEAGFASWLALSAAAENYDGEERCREEWDRIELRSEAHQRLTIGTYIAQAKELGWNSKGGTKEQSGESPRDHSESGDRASGLPKGVDPAAFVVRLADEAGDEFWLDQHDKPHVTFDVKLPTSQLVVRHAPVASAEYKATLGNRFYADVGNKVLTSEQASLAASLLEYRAKESGKHHIAAVRVGEHESKIYVDLGTPDGRAVEIDADGWRVVSKPPVRFTRGNRGELPLPQAGGQLEDFKRHFNVSDEDLTRVLGFMIGAFNVGGSYAMLLTDGSQGAGKSMLNDKVVSLIDPPRQAKSARMSFNSKEEDLHLGALGVHVIYFDNVSSFSAEAADALCRLSTGGGSGRRKLYSNDQYTELVVIRPIILTCIGSPTSRPDLLSRSVRITALPLGRKRRTEKAVMRAFEADRPRLIGFLFSCVSASLRNRAAIEAAVERGEIELPRMADFAEFVEGSAELLGLKTGAFSKLIDAGQSAMQTEAVLGHPVGAGLVTYFSRANATPIDAPAREVLQILRELLPDERRWPAANMLRKTLSRLSVGLQALGVEWDVSGPQGHDNVAKFRIRTTENFHPMEAGCAVAAEDQHF